MKQCATLSLREDKLEHHRLNDEQINFNMAHALQRGVTTVLFADMNVSLPAHT